MDSFNRDSGELMPELDCSWSVLGVVFVGELLGDGRVGVRVAVDDG